MEKKSDFHFSYPSNLHELDLATMVSMYRARGEPRKAAPGKYLACAVTRRLLKEGKWWFGLYYSQKAWDTLLTRNSEGYPLTEAELNVLGLVFATSDEPVHRDYIEKNCGVLPKLAYLIINDLKQFGFLEEDPEGCLIIRPRGERALQGICRRIYERRFQVEMLLAFSRPESRGSLTAGEKEGPEQTTLF